MPPRSPETSYLHQLIDSTKANALQRGAETPDWNDVWVAMTGVPEFAEVLRARNVNAGTLGLELSFMQRFVPEGNMPQSSAYTDAEIRAASLELSQMMSDILDVEEDAQEEKSSFNEVVKQGAQLVMNRMVESVGAGTADARKLQLYVKLLNHAVEQQMSRQFRAANPQDEAALDQIKKNIEIAIASRLVTQPYSDKLNEATPLQELEAFKRDVLTGLSSPSNVFEYISAHSEPVYQDLLHRNGLRSTDPDRQDSLENVLPAREVQSVMLEALRRAYAENAQELETRHVAAVLLESGAMQRHLNLLGIKDLVKFYDKVGDLLNPDGPADDEAARVFVHPRLTDATAKTVALLDAAFKDKDNGRAEEMLYAVIKADPVVYKALNRAGLQRRMLAEWRSKYDAKLPKTKAEKKRAEEKPKLEPQRVPQQAFDELVDMYATDYTAQARSRKFDPLVGNAGIVEQISTILLKRGKKNPCVVGEPGIGKTKALEGLAQAIVKGQAPKRLVGARLLMLDLQKMNDSPYVSEFETKFKTFMDYVMQHNAEGKGAPILVGIDELAENMDAGGHQHSPGFKGLVKPYLTSGDIFTISTTTEAEWRKQIEKDPAFARRVQPVHMRPPTDEETAKILAGLRTRYERHHGVTVPPAMLRLVANTAGQYIHAVNQPDKSIDLLDEAMAHAQQEGSASLKREHVMHVVSAKTNIPFSYFSESDNARYAKLDQALNARVLDQEPAVKEVAAAIKRAKVGFKKKGAPKGNFLFIGPTGVGKTELAKAVAEIIMGGEDNFLVRFDMSEYKEKHAAARFIGAPPGYVGYEEGGELINKLRGKPSAVYLFDEVEKAHADVLDALLAPLDDGIVTDGRGMKGNMQDVINIFTSNIGAKIVQAEGERLGLDPVRDHAAWREMARPIYMKAAKEFFKPEFLNRLDGIILFDSLTPGAIDQLVGRAAKGTEESLKENFGADLQLSPAFRKAAARDGFDVSMGARPLKRAWKEYVETPLADWLLNQNPRQLKNQTVILEPSNDDSMSDPVIRLAPKKAAGPKPGL